MFNCIDKKTQLLTRLVLHGYPRRLRPHDVSKIGKEEPWTLEMISYWSDKLSSILDYFTFDPQKKSILPIQPKSQVLFVYHVLDVPASPRPTSHVPVPLLVTASFFRANAINKNGARTFRCVATFPGKVE